MRHAQQRKRGLSCVCVCVTSCSFPATTGALEAQLREVTPRDIDISKETLDWINESATGELWKHKLTHTHSYILMHIRLYHCQLPEFLRVLGSKANDVAAATTAKENYRLTHEHVIQALQQMGRTADAKSVRAQHVQDDKQTTQVI